MPRLLHRLTLSAVTSRWNVSIPVRGYDAGKAVNLTVDGGEWVAVVGYNGIGKSTLLKTVAGKGEHVEGVICVDGAHLPAGDYAWRFLSGVQIVEQTPALIGRRPTLEDAFAIAFARRPGLLNEPAIRHLLGSFEKAGFLPSRTTLNPRMFDLLVSLFAAPSVLLLDEIVLDSWIHGKEMGFYELLRRITRETAVLFIDHDIDRAIRWADKLLWLREDQRPRVIPKNDVSGIKEITAVLGGANMPRRRDGIEDEELWLGIVDMNETPVHQVMLAGSANRNLRKKLPEAIGKIQQAFDFITDVCKASDLSGGQQIVLISIMSQLYPKRTPPIALMKSLDAERRKRLEGLREELRELMERN